MSAETIKAMLEKLPEFVLANYRKVIDSHLHTYSKIILENAAALDARHGGAPEPSMLDPATDFLEYMEERLTVEVVNAAAS